MLSPWFMVIASTFPARTSSLKKVYGTSMAASGPGKRSLTRRKFASSMSANQSQVLLGGMLLCPPGPGARRCSSDRFVVGRSSPAGVFVPSRCVVIRCLLSGSGYPAAPTPSRLARSARRRPRARRARRARPARAVPRLAGPPSPPRGRHPGSLPAPRRSSLLSFLDTLAYLAFIDTLWRPPRNPDQAMYNLWQRARVVHDVAAIQKVGVPKLLAGEPSRNGDDLHPGRQCPLHPRRGVFDRQALPHLEVELARRKVVHLGVGLTVLDVVAGDDHVELVLQSQDAEHAPGLFAVGLGGKGRRETFSSDAAEQRYVVGVAVLLDQFRVAEHLLVDAKPDLEVGLPRRAHAELRHTHPGRFLEPEAPHQADGDLPAREAHQVPECSGHFSLVQVRTQFGGGAGVGERL